MPPTFQNLMNDRLPNGISEAKMKSAEKNDTEKRHKHEQTQQQNDFKMQLPETLVATVERMKQSQSEGGDLGTLLKVWLANGQCGWLE